MDSSVEEVAGLLLAVAEQAHLEVARQARPAQRPRKRAEVSCLLRERILLGCMGTPIC